MIAGLGVPQGDVRQRKWRLEWEDFLVRRLAEELRRPSETGNKKHGEERNAEDLRRRANGHASGTKSALQVLHGRLKEAYGQDAVPGFREFLEAYEEAARGAAETAAGHADSDEAKDDLREALRRMINPLGLP